MQQQAPRYSAREALANALRAYQAAAQTRAQYETQAAATRDAALRQAQADQAQAQQSATATRSGQQDQARRLLLDVDRLSADADRELTALGLTPSTIVPATIPIPAGGSAVTGLNDQYSQVRAVSADLAREGQELQRVRQMLIPKIRRALHLPP